MRSAILKPALLILAVFSSAFCAGASEKDTVRAEDSYIEGVRAYCAGDYSSAESSLSHCLRLEPENDAAMYYLAMIHLSRNDTDKAMNLLDKASAISPGNTWYSLATARLYSGIGENDLAISIYETLIADHPSKSDYYYELIDLLVRSGELDKALEILDRIDRMRGYSEITGNARYEILMAQSKYDEALTQALKMNEYSPSPRTALILGDLYKTRYDDSTALHYYQEAVSMEPDYTPAYFGMAEIYRVKRDFINFFKSIDPFLADPQISPLMKTSYIEEIIFPSGMVQIFRPQVDTMVVSTLNAHPTDTSVLTMAGMYFIAIDSTDRGMDILHRNMELHPDIESVRMTYMGQLYYMQDWDALIPVAEETLSLFPDHFTLRELIAIAYWQKGDTRSAIDMYRQILKAAPDDHPVLLNCYGSLGDLYHETGDRRKSYSCYEKGLKIDDNYSPILNNYAYYLSEEGRQLKKALEMSRKTVLNEPENPTYLDTYGWLLYLTGDYQEARKYLEKAKIYGGDSSAVILDHYAETLFALKEYNLAFLYWGNADRLDPDMGLSAKIQERREQIKKR